MTRWISYHEAVRELRQRCAKLRGFRDGELSMALARVARQHGLERRWTERQWCSDRCGSDWEASLQRIDVYVVTEGIFDPLIVPEIVAEARRVRRQLRAGARKIDDWRLRWMLRIGR